MQLMQYRFTLTLVLYQELRYLFFYYQYAKTSSLSAPYVIAFLPKPPLGNENVTCISNEIPYPE